MMSRSEAIPNPIPAKPREQPHVIADRVARRLAANRLRSALGREPVPVTPAPEYPPLARRAVLMQGGSGE